jgi:ribosomal-protein-alanine N-acetyltransferase
MKWPGRESAEDLARAARLEKPWGGTIRALAAGDLDVVTALEARCNTQPWSREALKTMLGAQATQDASPKGPKTISLVAVLDRVVVGYILASAVADEGEVLILGVDSAARRQGVAAALLKDALARLRAAGAKAVFLEVRRGNEAAIGLYTLFGFGEAGVRKGYYADTGEDAVLMHVFLKA